MAPSDRLAPNPFSKKSQFANLAIALLGIVCWWSEGSFCFATIVATTVWLGTTQPITTTNPRRRQLRARRPGRRIVSGLILPAVLIIRPFTARISIRRA